MSAMSSSLEVHTSYTGDGLAITSSARIVSWEAMGQALADAKAEDQFRFLVGLHNGSARAIVSYRRAAMRALADRLAGHWNAQNVAQTIHDLSAHLAARLGTAPCPDCALGACTADHGGAA